MIKKLAFYLIIAFFVACGSNKNIVRTNKSAVPQSKPIARTVRKMPVKPIAKPITKKVVVAPKPIETKSQPIKKQEEKSIANNSEMRTDTPTQTIENPIVTNQQEDQIEILEATTRVKVTTAMVLDYIEKYRGVAKEDMEEYGIPASIILGQGILESGAGTGPLSAQANNHFGIKCHKEWVGPSVRYNDDEENECFRKYNNPKESYKDHSLFLTSRDRYSSLFKLDKSDYKSWAIGLKNAGYATDPSYPTKLIALIERYQLQKFDLEVLGEDYVSNKSNSTIKYIETVKPYDVNQSALESHKVSTGDTLYSISKKYNITIQDIKKKNNISSDTLSVGQNLIIK